MNHILATAQEPSSLLPRRPRLNTERLEGSRPDIREEPKSQRADAGADADMLDFIAKFEQNVAELLPERQESQPVELTDELLIGLSELPFDAEPAAAPPPRRPRTLELAKPAQQGPREPQVERPAP